MVFSFHSIFSSSLSFKIRYQIVVEIIQATTISNFPQLKRHKGKNQLVFFSYCQSFAKSERSSGLLVRVLIYYRNSVTASETVNILYPNRNLLCFSVPSETVHL